jgi:hypothetical protein
MPPYDLDEVTVCADSHSRTASGEISTVRPTLRWRGARPDLTRRYQNHRLLPIFLQNCPAEMWGCILILGLQKSRARRTDRFGHLVRTVLRGKILARRIWRDCPKKPRPVVAKTWG